MCLARLPPPRACRAERGGSPRLRRGARSRASAVQRPAPGAVRRALHAVWRVLATLLAGSAAYDRRGRTVALTACARNRVALAGRACLAMGDRHGGVEPPGVAALENRAQPRQQ